MKRILVACALAGLTGCPAHSGPPKRVTVVEEAYVENCDPRGTLEEQLESPNEDPELVSKVVDNLKARARRVHATHIVYVDREVDEHYARIKAEAYACDD